MTEDTSPENLRKFLESDDPALVRMGISLAKGAGVEVTVKDLKHFLKSEDAETIKAGIMLADEAGVGDEAMETFIKKIEGYGDDNWWNVVELLGEIGDARAVEALAELIFDEEAYKSSPEHRYVIEALGKIGDTRVIGDLIDALELDCERLREMECMGDCKRKGFGIGWHFLGYDIMNAIIQIGSKEAIYPLYRVLQVGIKRQDWQLPELAAEALTGLGWKPETDEQKASYLIATKDWEGCKKTGEPLVTKAVLYLEGPLHVYPFGHAETTCAGGCCGDYWFQESKDVMGAVDSFGETAIKIFKANECEDPLYPIADGAKALKVRDAAKEALKKLGHEVE